MRATAPTWHHRRRRSTRLELDASRRSGRTRRLREACLARRRRERRRRSCAAQAPTPRRLIDAFAACGLELFRSHFGRIEDLRTDNTTNQNTDQLGYTDAPVDLHTDQPFLDEPPRYQMLHCMRPRDDRGGENALADGRQAAEYLRSIDAARLDLLTTVPVRFHRQQKAFESELSRPIVELRDGAFFRCARATSPWRRTGCRSREMEAWYRAYNRFSRDRRRPRHHYRFRSRAGDFLLYDNHRMLHARTALRGRALDARRLLR